MTPDVISSLANLGAAGAVIIVVLIFLKFQKEQAAEWRAFFTALNEGNQGDIADMRLVADRITKALDNLMMSYLNHDLQAKEIKTVVTEIRTELVRLTQGKEK